jgi:hydroxymethylpyrimidine pyrophosphatase-like HAD family hydrolase
MRYHALACDYDGTSPHHGQVDEATVAGLERLADSGRKLLLVTGRKLDDLLKVLPQVELFDQVVAENGGLLYRPAD